MEQNSGLVPALLDAILNTQEQELTCGECFELIDQYVELLQSGQDSRALLPAVAHHLAYCHDCDEECQALVAMLESMAGSSETGPPNSATRWLARLASLLGRNGS